jgi:hypothetical protein
MFYVLLGLMLSIGIFAPFIAGDFRWPWGRAQREWEEYWARLTPEEREYEAWRIHGDH